MKIETISVSPIGTNCYLVSDGKLCCLVDPGGDAKTLLAAIRLHGYELQLILLTHGHYDHTGGVKELVAEFPALPIYLHAADNSDPADRRAAQLFPPLQGNLQALADGDEIPMGALRFRVLATPGHSKGSVTLLCEKTLFTGDTLFAGSCGRTDLLGGSMEEMLSSLKRLGELPGNYTVLPGHMEASDLDCERATNPYLRQALAK